MIIYRGLSKLLLCSAFTTISSASHGMDLPTPKKGISLAAIEINGELYYPECQQGKNGGNIIINMNDHSCPCCQKLAPSPQVAKKIEKSDIEKAVEEGDLDKVKRLVEKNKKHLTKPNVNGNIPLLVAASLGNLEIFTFLYKQNTQTIHSTNDEGNNVFHIAAQDGHKSLVEWLYKIAPKLASKGNDYNDQPIHLAAQNGHLEILKFFLQQDPSSLYVKADENMNILNSAIMGAEFEVVEFLCQKYPFLLDNIVHYGRNALLLCAQSAPELVTQDERARVFKFLANKTRKCDGKTIKLISEKDQNASNVVGLAASMGNTGIIQYLYENHKNYLLSNLINEVDADGYTALHQAVNSGHFSIVKALCEYSPKLMQMTNKEGQTPLTLSRKFPTIEITNFLEEKAKNTTITAPKKKKKKKKKAPQSQNILSQQEVPTILEDGKTRDIEIIQQLQQEVASLNLKEVEEISVMPEENKEELPFLPENVDISLPIIPPLNTLDLMVSGEGEELLEKETNNQTKTIKPKKTLSRTRSVINFPKPVDENVREDNSTQEIVDKRPRKTPRTLSVKRLPKAESGVQMDDKSEELKKSDKKPKRSLIPSIFSSKESTTDKKPKVDKKDKKKICKNRKPTKWNDLKREKKRLKTEKSENLISSSHEEGAMHASEESSFSEVSESENEHILQFPLNMTKSEKSVLDKIFDINKPEITENEFIDFCASEAMKDIIRGRKTKSGFLVKFRVEKKWTPVSAHWEHGGDKTGLDPAFIDGVKLILSEIGITPETVISK